jgi:hypothetical protein
MNALLVQHFRKLTEAFLQPFCVFLDPRFDRQTFEVVSDSAADRESLYVRHRGMCVCVCVCVCSYGVSVYLMWTRAYATPHTNAGLSRASADLVLHYVETRGKRVLAHFPMTFLHPPTSAALLNLYREFIRSPNYVPWYTKEFDRARGAAFTALCAGLEATNGEMTTTPFNPVTPQRLDTVKQSIANHWRYVQDMHITRDTCAQYAAIEKHYKAMCVD